MSVSRSGAAPTGARNYTAIEVPMVMVSRSSVRSFAISAAVVAASSLLAGCFGQSQSAAPTPIPPAPAASPAPSPAASPVVVPASSPTAGSASEGPGETHTVGEGETLATIAEKYYEDSAAWRKIYEANKDAIGDNPDSIKIGQTLKIPPK